jgi:hypothetical protein
MKAIWKCPHCGIENTVTFTEENCYQNQVLRCDIEDREGCDRISVVEPRYQTAATVYKVSEEPEPV